MQLSAPSTQGPARPEDAARLVAALRDQGVRTAILAGCDTHGIMRGKRVPVDELARALTGGVALCEAIWALLVDEERPVPASPAHAGYFPGDGYPDVLAVPDPGTLRLVPWHAHTALLLCDFVGPGGAPLPVSPRGVLRSVVERARAMGFEPVAGVELECYLLRETPASAAAKRPSQLEPVDATPRVYGLVAAARQEPFLARLREGLAGLGLSVTACNPEAGPGQLEVNLGAAPALAAADQAFLLKAAVKELAERDGVLATFMAKPRSDWPGTSCHLHLSLRDGVGEAFHDPARPDGTSQTMRRFVAGTLAAMDELTAIMAPTPNSYRRLGPYSWAGTTASWSLDNRSAGLRIVYDESGAPRVEHRQPGGDVNPYLALAAAIASGLHGVEQGLEPPEPVEGDLYGPAGRGLPQLPGRLEDAVELLRRSELARDWLGSEFVEHYVALRRAELDAQAAAVTDWETSRYLEAL